MADADPSIPIDASGDVTLSAHALLTGRGFITGKSGAGKTTTVTVVLEELFERGHPALIIDTEGEYWGLKETYEALHAGADEECDLQVGPEHGEKLAALALEDRVPIILDVSGYLDTAKRDALIYETCRHLFDKAKKLRRPFPVVVEEMHEYVPQRGSSTEAGEMLTRIAKRGRKRGLGLIGVSQRPAAVDKDVITQANWLVWHRLTWKNDTKVVREVLGTDTVDGTPIDELETGEAVLDADFLDADPFCVTVRPKRTFDAGATPDLDAVDQPALKSVNDDLVAELDAISEHQREREDELAKLEVENDALREQLEALEDELDEARQVDRTADRVLETLANVVATNGDLPAVTSAVGHEQAGVTTTDVRRQRNADAPDNETDDHEAPRAARASDDALEALRADLDALIGRHAGVLAVDEDAQALRARIRELEDETERLERALDATALAGEYHDLLTRPGTRTAVRQAADGNAHADEHFDRVLAILAVADGGPLAVNDIVPLADVSETVVRSVLTDLYNVGVLERETDGRQHRYRLDLELLEHRAVVTSQQTSPA